MNRAGALKVAQKYLTPRYIQLDRLERYVYGTQYEGRPHFFSSGKTPLLERAPCIVDPIVEDAIRSHCDFILGKGRFPKFTTFAGEDDTSYAGEKGLSQDDSAILDRFILEIVRQTRLQSTGVDHLEQAQAVRSTMAVLSIKDGKLSLAICNPKWATPEFDHDGSVSSVEIRYPYIDTYYDNDTKRYEARCLIYRRVIDSVSDTVYRPGVANQQGDEPVWKVDKEVSVEHNLGFCPVIWYKFNATVSTADDIDGRAIHERILDELDALNFASSQWFRAAFYAGDPQIYEAGVPHGFNPSPTGRAALTEFRGPNNQSWVAFSTQDNGGSPNKGETNGPGGVRQKGTGVVWTYPDPNTRVGMLTLPGDALIGIKERVHDLKGRIAEALSYVDLSVEDMRRSGGQVTGRALAYVFSPQTAWCDKIRMDFGDGFLNPVISMFMRIVLVMARRGKNNLRIPGVDKVLPILERFEELEAYEEGEAPHLHWCPPTVELIWGSYFESSETDEQAMVNYVVMAFQNGLVTKEMALAKLSGVFPMQSVADVAAELEEQSQVLLDGAGAEKIDEGPSKDPIQPQEMSPKKLATGMTGK